MTILSLNATKIARHIKFRGHVSPPPSQQRVRGVFFDLIIEVFYAIRNTERRVEMPQRNRYQAPYCSLCGEKYTHDAGDIWKCEKCNRFVRAIEHTDTGTSNWTVEPIPLRDDTPPH